MTDHLSRIRQQREKWIAAINDESASGFVAVIAEDAVWLPSMHAAVEGKDGIQAWLQEPFSKLDYDYSVSDVQVRVAGDWAVEQAHFSTRAHSKSSGQPMPVHNGRYLMIWRRSQSDGWLIDRYVDFSADFSSQP